MALSGTNSVAVNAYWRVQLEWTATQSISNNTSTVTAKLYWIGDGVHSTVYSTATKRFSITINGNTYSGTGTAALYAGQKRLLGTHTVTIAHNGDGTKTFAVSGTFDMEVTLNAWYGSRTTSGTYTLNTIPRTSSFTISDNALYSNESSTITITRASTGFTHTVKFTFGSATWSKTAVGTSTTFRPNDYANDTAWTSIIAQNSAYISGTITVTTYNGNTLIGSTSRSAQVYVPTNVVPTVGTMTITDSYTTVANLMGSATSKRAIQSQSNLSFRVSGHTAGAGSAIQSVLITCDGLSAYSTNWAYGAPSKAQTYTVTWVVKDLRGRSATGSTTFVSLAYSYPKITTSTVERITATPTNVAIRYGGTVSTIKNASNVEKNTYSVNIASKTSSTNYTTITNTAITTGTTLSATTYTQTDVSVSQSFTYRLTITDALGNSAVAYVPLSTEIVPLHVGETGIGIGKRREQGALDVKGNTFINGDLNLTGNVIISGGFSNIAKGTVTISASAPNTPTGVAVSWPQMSSNPIITTGIHSAYPGVAVTGVGFSGRSRIGTTFYLTRTDSTPTDIHYICIA